MQIQIQHISKSFDKKSKVLDDLNLTIEDGSLTTLLGFSGCGKTTLLRIISGLEKPDEGRIIFGDKTVFDKEKNIDLSPVERGIGFVFQDFALWPNMTVLENVEFGLKSQTKAELKDKDGKLHLFSGLKKRKKDIDNRAMEVLKLVKMEDYAKRLPSALSGGQKQRVAIARAIAINPKVILFDEPLSALDAVLREEMRAEIKSIVKQLKMTAIFVTHDQVEAMSISDEIVIMNKGVIAGQGKPSDIYWHPQTKFIAEFIGKASWLDETHFLRPEDIHSVQNDADIEREVTIKSMECQGGKYFLSAADDSDHTFRFFSSTEKQIGDKVSIYYRAADIKEIGEESLKDTLTAGL